jgi:hypothetical protein
MGNKLPILPGWAAGWLIFYAEHLKSKGLVEQAGICLEYAGDFASKAGDGRLESRIEEIRRELEK